MNHGWLLINFYGANLVFWDLISPWLSATTSHLDCVRIVSLRDAIGTLSFRYLKAVPANGSSRAHASYSELQFTLDPSREPHVNVPEVVGDEISSP